MAGENVMRDAFMHKTFGVVNDLMKYEKEKDSYDPLTNLLVKGTTGDLYQESPSPNPYLFHQLSDQPFPEPVKKSILTSGSYINRLAHLENDIIEKKYSGKEYNLHVSTNHLIPPVYINIGDCLSGTTNDKVFNLDKAKIGEPVFYRHRLTAESTDLFNYGKGYCFALVHMAQAFGDYICSESYPLGVPTNLFDIHNQIKRYGSLIPLSVLSDNIDIHQAEEKDIYLSAVSDFSHCKAPNFSNEPYFIQFLTTDYTSIDIRDLLRSDYLGTSDPIRTFVNSFDIHGVFIKSAHKSLSRAIDPYVVHYVRKGCLQDGCDRIYREIYNFYNMDKITLQIPDIMFHDLDKDDCTQSNEHATEFRIYFVVYRYNIAEIRFLFIKSRKSESYVIRKCFERYHAYVLAHNQSKLLACMKMSSFDLNPGHVNRPLHHKNYSNINSASFMAIKALGFKGPGIKSAYEYMRKDKNVCIDEFIVDIGNKYTFA